MADFSGDLSNLLNNTGNNSDGDALSDDDSSSTDTSDYVALKASHSNELASPSLQPYHDVSVVQLLIKNQNLVLAKVSDGPIEALTKGLMVQELERVKYILADYLRTRLRKIEATALYYSKKYPQGQCKETQRTYLSPAEQRFCNGFLRLLEGHQTAAVLGAMHQSLRNFDEPDMLPDPNIGTYVMGRILALPSRGEGEDEDPLGEQLDNAAVGDVLLVRWDMVEERVAKGELELIV